MRKVVMAIHTTGLFPKEGARLVEVAGIEIVGQQLTGRTIQRYINPGIDVEECAAKVHGITAEFLKDKPKFPDLADELLDFLRDSALVAHGAQFLTDFLSSELHQAGRETIAHYCPRVIDTLQLAREKFPHTRNSLVMLCARHQINFSRYTPCFPMPFSSSLLQAECIAVIYLAMMGRMH